MLYGLYGKAEQAAVSQNDPLRFTLHVLEMPSRRCKIKLQPVAFRETLMWLD